MPRPRLASRPLLRLAAVTLLAAALALPLLAAPARAGVFGGTPVVGPTPALRSLGGIDLAPDGSGAIAYTMQDGGADHVFVSRLVDGAWGGPERVDGGLGAASAQPVVAAGDGGRVVVAFVNAGNVYVATRAGAGGAWARQTLWGGGGASDPAADVSVNGKGYVAFAAPGAGGHDVRVAHARETGPWTVAGAPLDASPAADAGTGAGRPQLAASADGVAIVVWGESGTVIARRVQGTRPSLTAADARAGLVLEGLPAVAADAPVVSTQDDDSFTGVAFRAVFDVGGTPRSRAVFRRLRGSRFETPFAVDAAPFASGQSSASPRISTVGTGQGVVVAGNEATSLTSALMLLFDVQPDALLPLDATQSTAPTYAVPAAATARKTVVAWQLTPAGGAPEIRGRYRDGGDFGPETVLSRPEYGPTAAADGLFAHGDDSGNVAIAYVQDVPAAGRAIAVATIDQPPARFAAKRVRGFQRTVRPLLAWTTSREQWGRYFKVAVDGVEVATTGRRSLRPPALAQGAHSWQVTAYDRRGQTFAAPASTVRIDSVAPFATARVSGPRRALAALRLTVRALDTSTGRARGVAGVLTSGVRQILVDWGDRSARQAVRSGARTRHVYARPGRYALRVLVTDRAGNRRTVRALLRIARASRGGARGRAARGAR